jgi:hypothetical protein
MDHIDGPGRTILSVAMCFDPEFGIWNYRLGVFLQTRWARINMTFKDGLLRYIHSAKFSLPTFLIVGVILSPGVITIPFRWEAREAQVFLVLLVLSSGGILNILRLVFMSNADFERNGQTSGDAKLDGRALQLAFTSAGTAVFSLLLYFLSGDVPRSLIFLGLGLFYLLLGAITFSYKFAQQGGPADAGTTGPRR